MKVQMQIRGVIGIIVLQNGDLNLLSVALIRELNAALDAFESDFAIRVIIITSYAKAFCAGADLTELLAETPQKPDFIDDWQYLGSVQKPVIACVMGACFGGGLEITLMCDLIIASDNAQFAFPEVKLGLLPGGGGTQRINKRIGASRAAELLFTGASIHANKACEWGLVNYVFSKDVCFDETLILAQKIAQHSGEATRAIKRVIIDSYHSSMVESLDEGLRNERVAFYTRLFSANGFDGIHAFFAKK